MWGENRASQGLGTGHHEQTPALARQELSQTHRRGLSPGLTPLRAPCELPQTRLHGSEAQAAAGVCCVPVPGRELALEFPVQGLSLLTYCGLPAELGTLGRNR